jgi:hypothetical protein
MVEIFAWYQERESLEWCGENLSEKRENMSKVHDNGL